MIYKLLQIIGEKILMGIIILVSLLGISLAFLLMIPFYILGLIFEPRPKFKKYKTLSY